MVGCHPTVEFAARVLSGRREYLGRWDNGRIWGWWRTGKEGNRDVGEDCLERRGSFCSSEWKEGFVRPGIVCPRGADQVLGGGSEFPGTANSSPGSPPLLLLSSSPAPRLPPLHIQANCSPFCGIRTLLLDEIIIYLYAPESRIPCCPFSPHSIRSDNCPRKFFLPSLLHTPSDYAPALPVHVVLFRILLFEILHLHHRSGRQSLEIF